MSTDLRDLAVSIAVEAGELAHRRRREGVTIAATKSSIVDVVTEADREVEELVRARLAAARPDDAILGEEGGATAGRSGLTWLVDPIDGTVNYLYGIPRWAVSIAVARATADGWEPIAACVVSPASGELYAAAVGEGATRDGVPLRLAAGPALGQALLGTGFAYDAVERGRQGAVIARMLTQVRDIRREGSAALDLCAVADGRLDAYAEDGTNPWDWGAALLIAREAGAEVRIGPGRTAGKSCIVAAAPGLLGDLTAAWDAAVEAVDQGTGASPTNGVEAS